MKLQHLLFVLSALPLLACTDDGPETSEVNDAFAGWEEFRANPPIAWEAFRAGVDREQSEPYRFIVDGDLVLSSEQALRDYYDAWLRQEYSGTIGGSELSVLNVLGADVIWPVNRRNNLTYCVSNSFGTRKAQVVSTLARATRSWSDRVAVQFRYVPAQDANCTSANNNVLFNVSPVSASYFAAAFFPNSPRADRQLLITSAAFTTTAGGRDFEGILRHETGHVLGFRHEHIRITCTGETTANSRQVNRYDVNSVMHYPQCRPSGTGGYRQTALDFSGAVSLYGAP